MPRVAVVYFSHTDVTGRLAASLIEGLRQVDGVAVLDHRIDGREIVAGRFRNASLLADLGDCQGIVFGSPTYMGGVAAQFKAFADATGELWSEQAWADKVAAGFTSGSAVNGDQSSTLQYLVTFASQHGMIWVGLDSAHGYTDHGVNRLGCQLGVVAHSPDGDVHAVDLASAAYLGRRVGDVVRRLHGTAGNSSFGGGKVGR